MKDLLKDYNHKFSKVIIIAMERLGVIDSEIRPIINLLETEFRHLQDKHIINAINNGSMGMYGIDDQFNADVVSTWIYKYIKENK